MTKELLVVDDQPGIRLLLTDILMNAGYEVTTASDGREAVDLLGERQFALVMLDYKLPLIDGLGVLEKIKEMEQSVPTIVMSGLVEKIETELKEFPHVKQILAKPFNIEDIPVIVEKAINRV